MWRVFFCRLALVQVMLSFAVFSTVAESAVLMDFNWEPHEAGTLLTTIPGWMAIAGSANTPVIGSDSAEPENRFLTTGTLNNQASRHAFQFTNPGFDTSTVLTFTVDLYDPLVNSQSELSTFPRAVVGIFELGGAATMPSYFGMETSELDDVTTAEWAVAGENFGSAVGAPRRFGTENASAQDTWYAVQSVWDFGAGRKSLLVKERDSTAPFTEVFGDEPIGFLDVDQDLSALDALAIRLQRGTRLDNLRVTYTGQELVGDYNTNRAVDAADYTVWRDNFGSTDNQAADGNLDDRVDAGDYDLWKSNFGMSTLPERLIDLAEPRVPVVGAPAPSDVMFSVRSFFSSPSEYPSVAAAFGATRNDWTYAAHIASGVNALEALGMTSGGAMNASVHSLPADNPGIARHWDGVTPLSRHNDDRYSGDVNSPEYRQSALQRLKAYINAGNGRVQWDDPRMNAELVVMFGGSFAPASISKYRDWLENHTTPAQRSAAGLPVDLTGFDYRQFVEDRSGVVSSAANSLWMRFHGESTIEFFTWIKQEISEYAGFEVPFSSNNLGYWDLGNSSATNQPEYISIYRWFDYGLGELTRRDQNPRFIVESVRRAEELGKRQAFTVVSTDVELNRKVMAFTYAVGGHMVMPWDVYIPNSPRFFGDPTDYNDISHLVRDHAELFDGYEDAALVGPELLDPRSAEWEPMRIVGGSGQVYAFARAVPGDADAPVAVHLIEWDNDSVAFQLELRNEMFGWLRDDVMQGQLLLPGAAATLVSGTSVVDGYTRFALPALNPYALLSIQPAALAGNAAVPELSTTFLLTSGLAFVSALRGQRRTRQCHPPGGRS